MLTDAPLAHGPRRSTESSRRRHRDTPARSVERLRRRRRRRSRCGSRSPSKRNTNPSVALGQSARRARRSTSNTGCDVGRRGADDAQHLGGRGLRSSASLVSLNRRTFSIAITAWSAKVCASAISWSSNVAGRLAQDRDRAERLAVLQQRDEQARAVAERDRQVGHARELLRPLDGVGDGDDARLEDAGAGAAAAVERPRLEEADALRRRRVGGEGDVLDHVAARHRQVHRLAAEQAPAALDDRVEHRLRVGDRAADDAQDLGGRGLPLERLLGLVEQAHVLDRDHRLVGEGLEQLDLVLRERSGLAPGDADHADRRRPRAAAGCTTMLR